MEHRNTCEDKYPWIKVGDTIRLIHMDGEPDMPEGLTGRVEFFDSVQVHVRWANGSSRALIPEIDKYTVIKNSICINRFSNGVQKDNAEKSKTPSLQIF